VLHFTQLCRCKGLALTTLNGPNALASQGWLVLAGPPRAIQQSRSVPCCCWTLLSMATNAGLLNAMPAWSETGRSLMRMPQKLLDRDKRDAHFSRTPVVLFEHASLNALRPKGKGLP